MPCKESLHEKVWYWHWSVTFTVTSLTRINVKLKWLLCYISFYLWSSWLPELIAYLEMSHPRTTKIKFWKYWLECVLSKCILRILAEAESLEKIWVGKGQLIDNCLAPSLNNPNCQSLFVCQYLQPIFFSKLRHNLSNTYVHTYIF